MPFRFNRSIVNTLQTDGVFTSPSANPLLAYINLDSIVSLRRKYVHRPPCDRINPPVAALRQKRLRFLTPQVEAEDPCLVALAIALAQEQRQWQEEQKQVTTAEQTPRAQVPAPYYKVYIHITSGNKRCVLTQRHKIHLLVLPGIDAETLYIYSAHIPSSLLDGFDVPSQPSLTGCPISLLYYRITLARPETVVKKLLHVLCADGEAREVGSDAG